MLPPLNVLSDSYEISLKPLHFTVTKWRFSNVSQLKLTLWQWDDNNSVILISSILRPPPTVLIRTCTCCSATETLTPWFRLCLAPRRLKKWRVLSIPQTSLSRRIAACLTAHVRRSVLGRGQRGVAPLSLSHSDCFLPVFVGAGNGGYQTVHWEAASASQRWVNSEVSESLLRTIRLFFWTSSAALWDVNSTAPLQPQGDGDDVCPDRPERNHVTSWYGAQRQRRVTVAALRKF